MSVIDKVLNWVERDNRRSIRNYLLIPRVQLPMAFYVCTATIFFTLFSGCFVYLTFEPFINSLMNASDKLPPEIWQLFYSNVTSVLVLLGLYSLVYISLLTLGVIWYTHRLVGPSIAFKRQIRNLMNGKYDSQIKLRRGDVFNDVAEHLNELAHCLRDKEQGVPKQKAG